ncbi:pectinesterase inhibitor 10-like [Prosopis cineraria]|uniref:pectinesterase inhibitor 10-like n=1 Tax=Prosopis cineraria TaxID=364024 RepID=UPI00240FFAA0|nr:pectinesterase inhibitor 10-like [Prosopis cineraria]
MPNTCHSLTALFLPFLLLHYSVTASGVVSNAFSPTSLPSPTLSTPQPPPPTSSSRPTFPSDLVAPSDTVQPPTSLSEVVPPSDDDTPQPPPRTPSTAQPPR